MSYLSGMIQGAAETGLGIINQQMKNDAALEQAKALREIDAEIEERRMRTKMKMAEELGQRVNEISDQTRLGRIADIINSKNGTNITAEDVQDIAKNPDALQAYGIVDRTRTQELDDKASAAEKIGALDHAKMLRDQQNVEVNRASNERRLTADEKRNELAQAQLERQRQADEARKEHWTEQEKLSWAKTERALQSLASGGDTNPSKIRTAEVYLDRVNQERKKRGEEPLSFEEAFKISNYAQKDDPESKVRTKVASDLIKTNPLLANDPDALEKKVNDIVNATSKKSQPSEPKVTLPPHAKSKLKEKVITTFGNGEKWTLENGEAVRVK